MDKFNKSDKLDKLGKLDKNHFDKKHKGRKLLSVNERIGRVFIAFLVIFALLIGRLGWLQLVQGAELKEDMQRQMTASKTISPKRGTIYDSTGKALAVSAQVDTVSIDPTRIVVEEEDSDEIDEVKTKALKEKVAKAFSEIFELDYEETLEKVSSESSNVTIARKVENDKIEKLENWMEENEIYSGINIDEDTKRYYPYDNLASNLIGFCGTDNQGLWGLELKWNDILTGTPGKVTSAQDAVQDLIPYENETYIAPQNGNDITLTIDANIQEIAEKYLKQACEENDCEDGGNVIIMNPNNGDILAMATYPDYNLNDPYTLNFISEKEWKKLSGDEQYALQQETWNNKAITYTYEPGSVFKIITAAAGLEEGIVDADTANVFTCTGEQKVSGVTIHCSDVAGHGKQSLRDALKNSCNPAFIQLGQKIGVTKYYEYLKKIQYSYNQLKSLYTALSGGGLDDKTARKQFGSVYNNMKAMNSNLFLNIKGNFAIYGEMAFDNGSWKLSEGGAIIKASASGSIDPRIGGVFYGTLGISLSASGKIFLKYDGADKPLAINSKLTFEPALNIGIGMGSKAAKLYIEGGLKGKMPIDIMAVTGSFADMSSNITPFTVKLQGYICVRKSVYFWI